MKKVKVMLLSLALFAVVGGALAFKAKYLQTFCYTDAFWNGINYTCTSDQVVKLCVPTPTTNVRTEANATAGVKSYCTTDAFDVEIEEDKIVKSCKFTQVLDATTCPIQVSTTRNN